LRLALARHTYNMFDRGFRPFFTLAALLAALAIPLWLWALRAGIASTPLAAAALTPRDWHVHEMIFGYGLAVLAGFLLTAMPNWTKRPPVAGLLLILLVVLWLIGRIALSMFASMPILALVAALTFPLSLCALTWYEVLSAGNRRNLPVCVLLTLFACADVTFLGGAFEVAAPATAVGWGERGGIASLLLFISLIGGRVIPAFSTNWMKTQGITALPAAFGAIDKVALLAGAIALCAFVLMPDDEITGWLFAIAAAGHGLRLIRWRGWQTCREPLVLILHLGYLWMVAGLGLYALSIFSATVSSSSSLHALTAGAVGTMTLAIMTRATLGHSAQALHAGRATSLLYALVLTGALLRVAAPWFPAHYLIALTVAAGLWSGAFVVFLVIYGPMLLGPHRQDP